MGPEPPSLELVAAHVRRRQRATLAALTALVPAAVVLGLLALAALMVNGSGVALLGMLWPVVIVVRIAANLADDRRALAAATRLLAEPAVAVRVHRRELWIDGRDRRVRLPLGRGLTPTAPPPALPPARALRIARRG